MNKYLIFRTDRIGDFLLSMILIKSIKRNDKNSYIMVISSEKNYDYIKTFNLIDEVIMLKKGYINRVKLIFKLLKHKFNFSIIHDGKKRSKFINFFLKKYNTFNVNNDDIKNSHFIIGNDSGPSHIASCLNKKGLALFGPSTSAIRSELKRGKFEILKVDNLADLTANKILETMIKILNKN